MDGKSLGTEGLSRDKCDKSRIVNSFIAEVPNNFTVFWGFTSPFCVTGSMEQTWGGEALVIQPNVLVF